MLWIRQSAAMGLDPFEIATLTVGAIGVVVFLIIKRPALLSSGQGRLPKRFELVELGGVKVPKDVREPLAYLSASLGRMGFIAVAEPLRAPAMTGFGRHLLLVPFIHPKEEALFIMGIESQVLGSSEMMLHIISPLSEGRSIETTTLTGLADMARPPGVDARFVIDADSIEEIWSRHRLALTEHERSSRATVTATNWRKHAGATYDAWLRAALRANRITLDLRSNSYRIRSLPRRAV